MARQKILQNIFHSNRETLSDYLPWRFWDKENHCYDNMDKSIGWFWELSPLAFASDATTKKLDLLFHTDLPEGTVIQFILFADPRIRFYMDKMASKTEKIKLSPGLKDLTDEWIKRYLQHIDNHTVRGFDESVPVPVRNFRLFCAVKIPYADYNETVNTISEKKSTIVSILENMSLYPIEGTPGCLLHYARYVLNPTDAYENQNWTPYNQNMEINKQVIKKDNQIFWKKGTTSDLIINNKHLGVFTVGAYPETVQHYENLYLIGDIFNRDLEQISCPFIINLSFVIHSYNDEIKKKAAIILSQKVFGAARGRFEGKKADFSRAIQDIEANIAYNGVFISAITYADTVEQKARVGSTLKGLWTQRGFNLQEEKIMSLPIFLSSLPHGLYNNKLTREKLKRIDIAPTSSIAELVPVQAEWRGDLKDPAFFTISRRGQLQGHDLFNTSTNANFAIAAHSGAGKSFFAGYLVMSYLRLGDNVRIIDVGRSYQKLCKLLNGEFLEFSKKSKICINPFTYVFNIQEDLQMILPIMEKMSKPKEGCTDNELTLLREAIITAWENKKQSTTPARVGEILQDNKTDSVRCNLGRALMNYGPGGEYAKWYEGDSTLSQTTVPLQVLELEELNNDRHLRSLVLMFIIYQTVQLMYQKRDAKESGKRIIVLIDEAWDLFADESSGAAVFILEAYRKARKYGGAIGTITQSISDYYENEQRKAMLSNSAYWFLLMQKEEELQQLSEDDKVRLTPFMLKYISSVKTLKGKYSEIFIKTDTGSSIGRLFVDPFTYAILTTEPVEQNFIEEKIQAGKSLKEAIAIAADSNYGREII